MPKKIEWSEIVEKPILILKENKTIKVEFLDNGSQETTEIYDKKAKETKEITKYIFKVKDLNDNGAEKEFSVIQMRFMLLIKSEIPLKGKQFSINKFRFGSDDFDVDFKIEKLN